MAGPAPTVELAHQVQRTDAQKRKQLEKVEENKTVRDKVGGKYLILSLTEQRGPTRSM